MNGDNKPSQFLGQPPKVTGALALMNDSLMDYRQAFFETNRALNRLVSEIHVFSQHLKRILNTLPSA